MTAIEVLPARLRRAEAAEFLTRNGYPIAHKQLASLASSGTGPPYSIWYGRAMYRPGDLLDWAIANDRPVKRCASGSAQGPSQ